MREKEIRYNCTSDEDVEIEITSHLIRITYVLSGIMKRLCFFFFFFWCVLKCAFDVSARNEGNEATRMELNCGMEFHVIHLRRALDVGVSEAQNQMIRSDNWETAEML